MGLRVEVGGVETMFIAFVSRVGCGGVPGLQWPSLLDASGVSGLDLRWEQLLHVCTKRWVILNWRWYFKGVRVRSGGFSFVDTLEIGTVLGM